MIRITTATHTMAPRRLSTSSKRSAGYAACASGRLLALLGIVMGSACIIALINIGSNAAHEMARIFEEHGNRQAHRATASRVENRHARARRTRLRASAASGAERRFRGADRLAVGASLSRRAGRRR